MFKLNDYLVYQKNIYQIIGIKYKYLNNQDYYILNSVIDPSLTIKLPCNNNSIRPIINKDEVKEIIKKIPKIDIIKLDDKLLEIEYKKLLNGSLEDLIKIIKTTYLKNKERLDAKKKISDKDKTYFDKAELLLYTECGLALNMTFEDTKNYIIKQIEIQNSKKEIK